MQPSIRVYRAPVHFSRSSNPLDKFSFFEIFDARLRTQIIRLSADSILYLVSLEPRTTTDFEFQDPKRAFVTGVTYVALYVSHIPPLLESHTTSNYTTFRATSILGIFKSSSEPSGLSASSANLRKTSRLWLTHHDSDSSEQHKI
jgi:hypothetical protein